MSAFDPRLFESALQAAPLPVRYWHQRARLGPDAPVVRALQAELRHDPTRHAAEVDQRAEGHWGTIPHPETHELETDLPRFFNTIRLLVDHGATTSDESLLRALQLLWQLQTRDGGFLIFLHQMGDLLSTLGRAGLASDPRVGQLRERLLAEQRPDGGWLNPAYEPYAATSGGTSCVWTTVNVVHGLLATAPRGAREAALERAGTFLEANVLTPGYRSFAGGGMGPWSTMAYHWKGSRFFVGPHLVLEALASLGSIPQDPPVIRLWEHTMGLQGRDGWWGDSWTTLSLWRAASTFNRIGA